MEINGIEFTKQEFKDCNKLINEIKDRKLEV